MNEITSAAPAAQSRSLRLSGRRAFMRASPNHRVASIAGTSTAGLSPMSHLVGHRLKAAPPAVAANGYGHGHPAHPVRAICRRRRDARRRRAIWLRPHRRTFAAPARPRPAARRGARSAGARRGLEAIRPPTASFCILTRVVSPTASAPPDGDLDADVANQDGVARLQLALVYLLAIDEVPRVEPSR